MLERQPVTVDGSVPANMLRAAERSDLGAQARLSEDFYFARREDDRLRRAGGDPLTEAGGWTRFMGQGGVQEEKEAPEELERAGATVLSVLVPALAAQVSYGGARAAAALRVLSRIRIPRSLDQIAEAGKDAGLAPFAMASLSTFGGAEAAKVAMDILRQHQSHAVLPTLLPAMRGVPTPETLAALDQLASKDATQIGVAAALEGFGSQEYKPVLGKVLNTQDPWVLIHAIETMGRIGDAELASHIGNIYERVEYPQVRVACLQAIAESRARAGAGVAMAALSSGEPLVKAAAVETVVALPIPRKDYRDRVLALIDDPHPRVAMNAALACVVLDARRAVKRVRELIGSGAAAHLIQGIHCLSYMEDRSAAGILHAIVGQAPAGPVRIQAVRALGRRASRDPQAAGALARVLGNPDPSARVTAAWFMAGSHPAARGHAAGVLTQSLAKESDAGVKAVCAEALGMCGPAATESAEILGRCLAAGGPLARSSAWALATAFPNSVAASVLEGTRAVGLQSRGLLRAWYLGKADLLPLAELLGSADAAELGDAIEIARVVALTSELVGRGPSRLAALEASLGSVVRSAASGQPIQVEGAPAIEAMADLLGQDRESVAPAPQNLGGAPEIQPQMMSTGGEGLPSEDEAVSALAKVGASSEEAEEAIEKATYYQPGDAQEADADAPEMASPAALGVADAVEEEPPPPRSPPPASTAPPRRAEPPPPTMPPKSQVPAGAPPLPGAPPPATVKAQVGGARQGFVSWILQGVQLVVFFGAAIWLGQFLRRLVDP